MGSGMPKTFQKLVPNFFESRIDFPLPVTCDFAELFRKSASQSYCFRSNNLCISSSKVSEKG